MRRILALLLAVLLLAGCQSVATPTETAQTIAYDWVAGESLVSQRRTGLLRVGLNGYDTEVTDSGVYFLYYPLTEAVAPFILYMDNGSDSIIKLCSRADCTHDSYDCDACFPDAQAITCYGDHLYVLAGTYGSCTLYRMNLDGTDRVEIYDPLSDAREKGYSGLGIGDFMNGYAVFPYLSMDQSGNTATWSYFYSLDGSMEKPQKQTAEGSVFFNCGETFLGYVQEVSEANRIDGFVSYDPETDTSRYLTDYPGAAGYFDEEKGIYFIDGAVRMVTYASGEDTVLFETGLDGNYALDFFPDCLVVAGADSGDDNLYIYNWDFQLVDTVYLSYPHGGLEASWSIMAETAERFILTDSSMALPRYYIEKSELGTGRVKIHQFSFPDMPEEIQKFDDMLGSW